MKSKSKFLFCTLSLLCVRMVSTKHDSDFDDIGQCTDSAIPGRGENVEVVIGALALYTCQCKAGYFRTFAFEGNGHADCLSCVPGMYNPTPSTTLTICSDCVAGKYSQASASTICHVCDFGKYSSAASSSCKECQAGKYSDSEGLAQCKNCPAGKYKPVAGVNTACEKCEAGKYNPFEMSQVCYNCEAGKYKAMAGENTACDVCPAGTYKAQQGVNTACDDCQAGKYTESDWTDQFGIVNSPGSIRCTDCAAGKFKATSGVPNACVICVAGKYSVPGAASCTACVVGKFSGLAESTSVIACSNCTAGTYSATAGASICLSCAAGKYLKSSGVNTACLNCTEGFFSNQGASDCEQRCPKNQYTDQDGTCRDGYLDQHGSCQLCSHCPIYSSWNDLLKENGFSWNDCYCKPGFEQKFLLNDLNEAVSFECVCRPGFFVNNSECIPCQICDPGHYRQGCENIDMGTCVLCETCDLGQQRAGCGFGSPGVCKDNDELVRMPDCPVKPVMDQPSKLEMSVRQASGLGAFSFEQVFGTTPELADFVCSSPCDGVTYDSIQCDGPFACNVKTCAQSNSVNELVKACPVVIEEGDSRPVRDYKRAQICVPCNDCGHQYNKNFDPSWGLGCVRECSKLMCSDNMLWDWTARKCKMCSDLRSMMLCSTDDRNSMSLQTTRTVTGNWPLLYFPDCEGNSATKKLESFTYGRCATCDQNKAHACKDFEQYPAVCTDGGLQCQTCHRAGTQNYVEVLKGKWFNSQSLNWELLHCQISTCLHRSGQDWTGVGKGDDLCMIQCLLGDCKEQEVEVACRLPHQARCEQVFPLPGSAERARTEYFDGEVNLLNEANDNQNKHRRFASFENTLIVLDSDEREFQCVWNAHGIFDNQASPGGVSNVLWVRGSSKDAEYETRGTKVCREWQVEAGAQMPLLPLQNTISSSDEETEDNSRHILVNTEAYVLSYRFDGNFMDPNVDNVQALFTDDEHEPYQQSHRMLRDAHVGGAGRLFLMMILHEDSVVLAVNVPSDRSVHSAMWMQFLLVSFAVVDLTQSTQFASGLTVSVSVTKDEKHMSDLNDNFVLESFWVQELSSHVAVLSVEDYDNQKLYELGNTSSLFRLQAKNQQKFDTWDRCYTQPTAVIDLQLAPWATDQTRLSWLDQYHGSIRLMNVSFLCIKNAKQLAMAACENLGSVPIVYVRHGVYKLLNTSRNGPWNLSFCEKDNMLCTPTNDTVLLSLLQVQQYVDGAPSADHYYGIVDRVQYTFAESSKNHTLQNDLEELQQAHLWAPFQKCAVLLTTQKKDFWTKLLCVGSGGFQEISIQPHSAAWRLLGAFGYILDNKQYLIQLQAGMSERSAFLGWNSTNNTFKVVIDPEGLALNWVSVCVETIDNQQQIAALSVNKHQVAQVQFFVLESFKTSNESLNERLELKANGNIFVFRDLMYAKNDQNMHFCRVVVAQQQPVVLVVGVTLRQVQSTYNTAGGSRLLLNACVGSSGFTKCESTELSLSPNSPPSFISAAVLRYEEDKYYWVVAVYGLVFAVTTSNNKLMITPQKSDLSGVSFVKVDRLFYTFGKHGVGVLTYLPGFEKLRLNSSDALAYAVFVVPVGELITEPVENKPKLILRAHYASYHVEVPDGPSFPVYELMDSSAGNESTQLVVSQHKTSPFAQRKGGFFAKYAGSGLNHRIGLPHAYGRYEQVFTNGSVSTCKFTNTLVEADAELQIKLQRAPDRLAMLMFEVPCNGVLKIQSNPVVSECVRHVLLVINQALQWTTYYLKPDTEKLIVSDVSDVSSATDLIISMGVGVAWVNSLYLDDNPSFDLKSEMRGRLLRARQLQQIKFQNTKTPVGSVWQRERHVLTLNPVENMRLELAFVRKNNLMPSMTVSVGVDDVQLAPVLSQVPPLQGDHGQLCTPVRVPSKEDLRHINLQHLIVNQTWEFLHVTVGLQTEHEHACTYNVRLYLTQEYPECPVAANFSSCTGILCIGCQFTTSHDNVRGAYQECQLQVPILLQTLSVVVWPETNADCRLDDRDSLVVSLRPHTAIYDCPAGEFVNWQGTCSNCHDEAHYETCNLGQRLEGCPAVANTGKCIACTEGADEVVTSKAKWLASNTSICAWECLPDHFESLILGSRQCMQCTISNNYCAKGEYWQPCSSFEDSKCVKCPNIRANEEFVSGCEVKCKEGYYNYTGEHADGRCLRCWTRNELLLSASQQNFKFFFFDNCSATQNAAFRPCQEEKGSRIVDSDPAFTGDCIRECDYGWHKNTNTLKCEKCDNLPSFLHGFQTVDPLPDSAFTWHKESCNFTCIPPYKSTLDMSTTGSIIATCVMCKYLNGSNLCPVGQYPAKPYCECQGCIRLST